MTLGDTFTSTLFKQTYQKVFSKDHRQEYCMSFNANIDIKVCYFSYIILSHFTCLLDASFTYLYIHLVTLSVLERAQDLWDYQQQLPITRKKGSFSLRKCKCMVVNDSSRAKTYLSIQIYMQNTPKKDLLSRFYIYIFGAGNWNWRNISMAHLWPRSSHYHCRVF